MNLEKGREKCRKKRRYSTKNLAEKEGKLFFSFKDFKVYQCPYCGEWHLTSQNSWK